MNTTKFGSAQRAKQIFAQKEDTNRMMRSLPKSKKKGNGGITSVFVFLPTTREEPDWHSVTDGPDIERLILDRNIQHFGQAGETPLATNEVIDMLGFGGDTELAQKILEGTADIPNITDNKAAQLLLVSMKRDTDPIILNFTEKDMMDRYKNWKEKTVTSVHSRQHLGHLHALFRAFAFSSDDEYNVLCIKQDTIIRLHFLELQISAKNKYVFQRWKHIVTQMIEKDPGCPKLFRLRVIHLYECDLNLLLSLYFCKLQQHYEDNKLLNNGCYGRTEPTCNRSCCR